VKYTIAEKNTLLQKKKEAVLTIYCTLRRLYGFNRNKKETLKS
ncbi:unnamed protein product, partial [Heterotrigona itama]